LHIGIGFRRVERVFDVAALAAEDRSTWSATARLARLVELRALQERLDAEVLRAVGDCDALDAWEIDFVGAVSWLASKTGLVRGAAARLVRTARFVRRHSRTAKALDAGDVSVPHVEMLAAAAHRRDELYEEHETVLLDAAATVEVQDFPRVTRRWISLADDELARRDASFAFDRRGFTLSPTTGGSALGGFLDPEASVTVTTTLDELQPPDGSADTRSVAQRRADALVLLCERARGGKLPTSRPIAGAEVVVSDDVLARHSLIELGAPQCEIEGFGPIPRATAERMLCDCAVGRVVMRGRSQILDLGRRTRTVRIVSGAPSCCVTNTANSPVVEHPRRGATLIISGGGPGVAKRAARTARCSAVVTTLRCTRAVEAGPAAQRSYAGRVRFSEWLDEFDVASDADVPCGACTACCTSSQFVHIAPDETETLARVPVALRFPAPGLPAGHVVLGYDERGHCPMLIDGACSIYEHRPRTCRTYDCRVFAVTGVEPEGQPAIAAQVRKWRFEIDEPERWDAARAAVPDTGPPIERALRALSAVPE